MNDDEIESLKDRVTQLEAALGTASRDAALAFDYAASDPKGAAAKAGLVTEHLLERLHAEWAGGAPARQPSIGDLLRALADRVPGNIRVHIEIVQRFRNAGAHASRMDVRAEDLHAVLASFVCVVEWYVETAGKGRATSPGLLRVRLSRSRWRLMALAGVGVAVVLAAMQLGGRPGGMPASAPGYFETSSGARRVRATELDHRCPTGQFVFRITGEPRAVAALAASGRCTVLDGALHCCAP